MILSVQALTIWSLASEDEGNEPSSKSICQVNDWNNASLKIAAIKVRAIDV